MTKWKMTGCGAWCSLLDKQCKMTCQLWAMMRIKRHGLCLGQLNLIWAICTLNARWQQHCLSTLCEEISKGALTKKKFAFYHRLEEEHSSAAGSIAPSQVQGPQLLPELWLQYVYVMFHMFSLCLCGFAVLWFQKRLAGRWTGYAKLPQGVKERVPQCNAIQGVILLHTRYCHPEQWLATTMLNMLKMLIVQYQWYILFTITTTTFFFFFFKALFKIVFLPGSVCLSNRFSL